MAQCVEFLWFLGTGKALGYSKTATTYITLPSTSIKEMGLPNIHTHPSGFIKPLK